MTALILTPLTGYAVKNGFALDGWLLIIQTAFFAELVLISNMKTALLTTAVLTAYRYGISKIPRLFYVLRFSVNLLQVVSNQLITWGIKSWVETSGWAMEEKILASPYQQREGVSFFSVEPCDQQNTPTGLYLCSSYVKLTTACKHKRSWNSHLNHMLHIAVNLTLMCAIICTDVWKCSSVGKPVSQQDRRVFLRGWDGESQLQWICGHVLSPQWDGS